MLMIVLAFAVGRIVSIVFVFSPGVGGCSQAVKGKNYRITHHSIWTLTFCMA
jgi:hypothetical protein